jgi:hypothetical protein
MIGKPDPDLVLDRGRPVHPEDEAVHHAPHGNPKNGRDPAKANEEKLLVEITKDGGSLAVEIQPQTGQHF